MNQYYVYLVTAIFLFPLMIQVEAIGGRGEGFRGRPDSKDQNSSVEHNYTPSMSRSTPSYGDRSVYREADLNRNANPAVARPKVENNINTYNQRTNYIPKVRAEPSISRENLGSDLRNQTERNWDKHKNWFDKDYWRDHPNSWYQNPENINWWGVASWRTLSSWLPWGWGNPIYYTYGSGGNVYFQDDSVYVDGNRVSSGAEYAQQAAEILSEMPNIEIGKTKWLPLGVFALTSDNEAATSSNMYLQLAINKDGVLSGTYINTITDVNQQIQGMVDQKSQRAVWKILGNGLIMETGANNLTENQSGLFVHFPDGKTQTWLMVRLQQPN